MEKDTKFLIKIVKQASKLITPKFVVKAKDENGDLVTTFDYEIEKFLIKNLNKKYPNFDIISEEFNSKAKLTKNCFTIDPIDGTINFANGIPLWVIQVGMIKDGKACCAVIYAPKLKEIYYADKTGAYKNNKKIQVKALPLKNCLYEIDGKPRIKAVERMSRHTKHNREFGSAGFAYAYVASGKISGTIFRNETPWDYVPGVYLVNQAGGYVIDKKEKHIAANTKEFAIILEQNAAYKNTDKQV